MHSQNLQSCNCLLRKENLSPRKDEETAISKCIFLPRCSTNWAISINVLAADFTIVDDVLECCGNVLAEAGRGGITGRFTPDGSYEAQASNAARRGTKLRIPWVYVDRAGGREELEEVGPADKHRSELGHAGLRV